MLAVPHEAMAANWTIRYALAGFSNFPWARAQPYAVA